MPKAARPWVATLVRTIFDQSAAEEVAARPARVVASLETKHPQTAEHLDAVAAPTWSGSSPTGPRSSASSAPY